MVLTGVDFVTIVLTSYAIRTAILVPLILALFWSRMTGWGFVGGTVLAIAVGMPIRAATGDLWGSLSILAISAIIALSSVWRAGASSTSRAWATLETQRSQQTPKRRRRSDRPVRRIFLGRKLSSGSKSMPDFLVSPATAATIAVGIIINAFYLRLMWLALRRASATLNDPDDI